MLNDGVSGTGIARFRGDRLQPTASICRLNAASSLDGMSNGMSNLYLVSTHPEFSTVKVVETRVASECFSEMKHKSDLLLISRTVHHFKMIKLLKPMQSKKLLNCSSRLATTSTTTITTFAITAI